ncbi:uncharacterized protein CIMG_11331 [Coccidioides immitis RS]|uniref:Uncharacterized protein n=1 Tax=Coccidioides immitis (strain RS) TaxID=246410 RepID=A0A0D8JV04_COCIM|nr:uncharacterized protein CIMG_11331 [Coccidioides immitis RS]KJF60989.1 hypothetical protein CIMG_11331 [Coccidioides immitis RS]
MPEQLPFHDLRIEDANNSSVRSIRTEFLISHLESAENDPKRSCGDGDSATSAGITSKGDGDSRDQIPLGRSDGGFLGAAGFRHWPGLPALSADDLFPDSSRAAPKQGYRIVVEWPELIISANLSHGNYHSRMGHDFSLRARGVVMIEVFPPLPPRLGSVTKREQGSARENHRYLARVPTIGFSRLFTKVSKD